MILVEFPEISDFIDAHELVSRVSEIRTPGFNQSTENGTRKLFSIIEDSKEFEDPYNLAAFILIETINWHAFNDGNHRTAWIVAKQILRRNDEKMHVENIKSFDEIERDLKSEVKVQGCGASWKLDSNR